MPVYIAVEVARRELEARLLLGLVAAERGHDVVLGKLPHRALIGGELDGWRLPPGILHLKSITAAPHLYERFDAIRANGTLITVQDEEHGLAGPRDYTVFGRNRFPPESLSRLDRLMCWGPLDAEWFTRTYPDRERDAVRTGSPRMDLWRPDLIGSSDPKDIPDGYVLIVSSTSPFGINPFWAVIHNTRQGLFGPGFDGEDDPAEFAMYDDAALAYQYVKQLVRGIRRLAVAFPDRTFVVRPHHFEQPLVWEALIGSYPNVIVRADGSSRSWVRGAAVVVQSGSTVAIEASVADRPVITFLPPLADGASFHADWSANHFGRQVVDLDELVGVLRGMLGRSGGGLDGRSQDLLAQSLDALDGPLAADRIVDSWEEMMGPALRGRVSRDPSPRGLGAWIRRSLRAGRDALRASGLLGRPRSASTGPSSKGPFAMEVQHKFPSLDVDALRADAERLSAHLGRFKDVEIVQIGEREVLLRAAGR